MDSPQTDDPRRAANRRGVVAMSTGMASFVANDSLVKHVSESLPASQLIFIRGVFATLLLLAISHAMGATAKLRTLREALPRPGLFINARIDTYLQRALPPEALEDEARSRMARYAAAGADGLFLPGLADLDVARRLAASTPLPLNLMSWPGLPGADALRAAGVRRLSAGASLFKSCYGALLTDMSRLHEQGEFDGWAHALDYARTNAWMDAARGR